MHYLIYKITNRLNNKIYVGKHKTENVNDDYFGSGLLLERAVSKHGKENFVKEILFDLPTEEAMNQMEADIVDADFVARDDTYNIKLGGNGGWDYINENDLNHTDRWKKTTPRSCKLAREKFSQILKMDEEFSMAWREKISNSKKLRDTIFGHHWSGKKHSADTRAKMRSSKIGKYNGRKNPAFGRHWITNGIENKFTNEEVIPTGWRLGRV